MADRNLTLAMRLYADAARFVQGLQQSSSAVSKFTSGTRREFDKLRNSFRSVESRLAAIGITIGATATIIQSARLDKSLTQIGLTAGTGRNDVAKLRKELFRLAQETGQPVEELQQGFNNLIQSGLNWHESLRVIEATNKAMAVTNAQADALTGGLSVAATAFDFDLSKPGMAVKLLDQMVVAGRLGNAELENLSGIFARVGVNSRAAGLGFQQTLAFIEGLSMIERQPERLATLADSTLRLFTNANYRKAAQKATSVRFFDDQGAAGDPLQVLRDMRTGFQAMKTDADRARFINSAFGQTDLDTQRGLRTLLTGSSLDRIGQFTDDIGKAGGSLDRDLQTALDNSVNQVGRLKAALRSAADGFIQPINAAINHTIKKMLDSRDKGGMGLSGGQILGGAAATLLGGYALKRFGGPLVSRLIGGAGTVATGVAAGKALEVAAGVTPVFVTNWPGNSSGAADVAGGAAGALAAAKAAKVFGGWRAGAAIIAGTPLKNLATLGATGIVGAAGMAGAAGAAGYGAGSLIYKAIDSTTFADKLGETIARALSLVGNDSAREAIALRKRDAELNGTLKIEIDDKRSRITEMSTNQRGVTMDAFVGRQWAMP